VLLLDRRLALAHHRLRRPLGHRENVVEVATDWLAAGLDPARSTLFIQSLVPQHAELHLLLSMVVPVSWLERVPTYKEQQQNLAGKDLSTYGFLGYPLLQTADIIIYKADAVPVGRTRPPISRSPARSCAASTTSTARSSPSRRRCLTEAKRIPPARTGARCRSRTGTPST